MGDVWVSISVYHGILLRNQRLWNASVSATTFIIFLHCCRVVLLYGYLPLLAPARLSHRICMFVSVRICHTIWFRGSAVELEFTAKRHQ